MRWPLPMMQRVRRLVVASSEPGPVLAGDAWRRRRASRSDLVAGLSVAMLVIPQSMAYAELAGLSGFHGLYASALPLVAAGVFASCPYIQTGPVALTALLAHGALASVAPPGSPAYAGSAAVLALVVGATRVAIGFVQAGKITYLMSQPVLRGFTSGAAVLILLSQLPSAVGLVSQSASGPVGNALIVVGAAGSWNWAAVALTAGTATVTLAARRIYVHLPGALIAVLAGIAVSLWAGYAGPVVGEVPGTLPLPSLTLPWRHLPQLVFPGMVIALVGFAESTAIARGFASQDRVRWLPDREFLAQGAANVVSGVFGGMPVDGSFSRSNLNHLCGAVSRWSGIVTGAAVFVFLPFAGVLSQLPKAVLAGIVIAAVVGLVRPLLVVKVWKLSRVQAIVVWFTLVMCLLLAPRIEQALLLGVLMSLAIHVWRERRAGFASWMEGNVLHLEAMGILWFASAPRLEEAVMGRLSEAGSVSAVVIHLDGLGRIDLTGALVLKRVVEEIGALGVQSSLEGIPPQSREIVENVFGMPPGTYL